MGDFPKRCLRIGLLTLVLLVRVRLRFVRMPITCTAADGLAQRIERTVGMFLTGCRGVPSWCLFLLSGKDSRSDLGLALDIWPLLLFNLTMSVLSLLCKMTTHGIAVRADLERWRGVGVRVSGDVLGVCLDLLALFVVRCIVVNDIFSLDRATLVLLILLVLLFILIFRTITNISTRSVNTKNLTYPTLLTAWATGPSRSICSLATRYLATNILRSFQTSIISS